MYIAASRCLGRRGPQRSPHHQPSPPRRTLGRHGRLGSIVLEGIARERYELERRRIPGCPAGSAAFDISFDSKRTSNPRCRCRIRPRRSSCEATRMSRCWRLLTRRSIRPQRSTHPATPPELCLGPDPAASSLFLKEAFHSFAWLKRCWTGPLGSKASIARVTGLIENRRAWRRMRTGSE